MDVILKYLRILLCAIDSVIYWLLVQVFNLLYSIANTSLFSASPDGTFGGMQHNIYSILGVIMLFKISFTLISYIVNPDQLNDKSAGAASIIKNVIIVIGLTLLVPIIFEKAMYLQRIVLREDILGRIVTGRSKAKEENVGESAGKVMATNIISGFIAPDYNRYPGCDFKKATGDTFSCDIEYFDQYYEGYKTNDYTKMLNSDVLVARDSDDSFLYNYTYVVCGITGFAVGYIVLLSCITISIRAVKLIFLQMISPIPIAAYLDKKGRDGLFKKWTNMCVSTYLQLFIRLAAIYFAVYIVQNVIFSQGGEGTKTSLVTYDAAGNMVEPGIFVQIFLLFGCLSFAKELPKLLEDMFGAKGGDFSLNPLKSAGVGALAGFGAGAIGGAINNYQANRSIGRGRFGSMLRSVGGATMGGFRGGASGMGKPGDMAAFKTAIGKGSNRIFEKNKYPTFGKRVKGDIANKYGIDLTGTGASDQRIKKYDMLAQLGQGINSTLETDGRTEASFTDKDGNAVKGKAKDFYEQSEIYKNAGNVTLAKKYKDYGDLAKEYIVKNNTNSVASAQMEQFRDFIVDNQGLFNIDKKGNILGTDGDPYGISIDQVKNGNLSAGDYKNLMYLAKDSGSLLKTKNNDINNKK